MYDSHQMEMWNSTNKIQEWILLDVTATPEKDIWIQEKLIQQYLLHLSDARLKKQKQIRSFPKCVIIT